MNSARIIVITTHTCTKLDLKSFNNMLILKANPFRRMLVCFDMCSSRSPDCEAGDAFVLWDLWRGGSSSPAPFRFRFLSWFILLGGHGGGAANGRPRPCTHTHIARTNWRRGFTISKGTLLSLLTSTTSIRLAWTWMSTWT